MTETPKISVFRVRGEPGLYALGVIGTRGEWRELEVRANRGHNLDLKFTQRVSYYMADTKDYSVLTSRCPRGPAYEKARELNGWEWRILFGNLDSLMVQVEVEAKLKRGSKKRKVKRDR